MPTFLVVMLIWLRGAKWPEIEAGFTVEQPPQTGVWEDGDVESQGSTDHHGRDSIKSHGRAATRSVTNNRPEAESVLPTATCLVSGGVGKRRATSTHLVRLMSSGILGSM